MIAAEDFALIQGLPGTGKSATVAFLTRLLVAHGKRVLLTSYTHSAVDNLLCKLLDSGVAVSGYSCDEPSPIVRIGRESACHSKVHAMLAQNVACMAEAKSSTGTAGQINIPNANFLHSVVSSAKIVGVTALTAPKSPLLSGQHFDYVIVDEAGQINQPAILGAITSADKFVVSHSLHTVPVPSAPICSPLRRLYLTVTACRRSHAASSTCSIPGCRASRWVSTVISKSYRFFQINFALSSFVGFGVSMLSHLAEGFPDSVAKLTLQVRLLDSNFLLFNCICLMF